MEPRKLLYFDFENGFSQSNHASDAQRIVPIISEAGWEIHTAPSTHAAHQLVREHEFAVGLTNVKPDVTDRIRQHMTALCQLNDYIEWVALLSADTIHNAKISQLISQSFFDYHTLPVDKDRLLTTIGHAYGMAEINRNIFNPLSHRSDEEMVGVSAPMRAVFRDIRKIAGVDAPILITGESGTGKELAARAIHERSRRAPGPFIAVNCASLPASIVQSELFGHEQGAFTGAQRRKIGHIESAAGGTLFLDEIGDLTLELQVNLLRFLQQRSIVRVGSSSEIPVDVRVIAATNVNLEGAINKGKFREDLYFRLNVLRLEMPPLRTRGEDIEVLARFFFNKFSREKSFKLKNFSSEAIDQMVRYSWPGNVRELINRIRRAMVMCEKRFNRTGRFRS